jgi:hypothetical protein
MEIFGTYASPCNLNVCYVSLYYLVAQSPKKGSRIFPNLDYINKNTTVF